jgi:tripartite-type tricarboxylate transporter receptor subunit TctC
VIDPRCQTRIIGEWVLLAKAQAGKLHFDSSIIASSTRLAGKRFRYMARIETVRAPNKAAPAALTDLLGGRIQFLFASSPLVMTRVRNGGLRAIAATQTKRAAQLPERPTLSESGVPSDQSTVRRSLLARAKMPALIIQRLHAEVADIARQPDPTERLAVDASEVIGSLPKQLADHNGGEIARWTKVVKAIGLKR